MKTKYKAGTRVHEYLLEECLGVGAFGEVWRARHHITANVEVAIKLPLEAEFVSYLKQEGDIVHRLRHANIVGVLGFDPFAELPYLVMELVRGPSLRQVLEEHSAGVSVDNAIVALRGILNAMAAAHELGVVHRDLKPANVLLDLNGRSLHELTEADVKVSDFGLGTGGADMLVSIAQSVSLNRDEQLVGTIAYMAPELRDGRRAPSPRSDLYSIGVLLFELLTGERPGGFDLPSAIRSTVPESLDRIFRRLYTRYEIRYESAQAALDDITAQLGERKTTAYSPPAELEQIAPHYGLDPLVLDLGDGVTMELVVIQAGEFLMGAPAHEQDSEDDERPQHRVRITKPFYLGRHTVTRAQWRAIVGAERGVNWSTPIDNFYNDWSSLEDLNMPVDSVYDKHVELFCVPLAERVGKEILLPTEAQWEYACRAGTTTPYFFGQRLSSEEHAHCDTTSSSGRSVNTVGVAPVGSYAPNAWGLYDMHGNVWERCRDWFGPYAPGFQMNPTGPSDGADRVRRGGCWDSVPAHVRSARRAAVRPDSGGETGFRIMIPVDLSLTLELGNDQVMEMMLVPPGEFMMGSREWEIGSNRQEAPRHRVRITKAFYIGKFPVTQVQWQALFGDTPAWPKWRKSMPERFLGDALPVNSISWRQCQEFCRLLCERTRRRITLPTEAEWEYACRAGTTTAFNVGDTLAIEQAYFQPEDYDVSRAEYVAVGSYPPNAWGLHDMHGVVGEFCQDWMGEYRPEPHVDPTGPAEGTARVVRGGSGGWPVETCRSASRTEEDPETEANGWGLRVVLRLE